MRCARCDPKPTDAESDQGQTQYDLRGAFALNYALASVIRGVASMANDQLDECMARLQAADALACLDCEWVGKPVVRGVAVSNTAFGSFGERFCYNQRQGSCRTGARTLTCRCPCRR